MSKKISELRVGDTVAISTRGRSLLVPYQLDWVVTKITPTGQITVEKQLIPASTRKRRFTKDGVEMGVGHYFPSLEPDHLKAVREVHLWKLVDDVRKALDALRKELNSGAMPATYSEHVALDVKIRTLHKTYSDAVVVAYTEGALE